MTSPSDTGEHWAAESYTELSYVDLEQRLARKTCALQFHILGGLFYLRFALLSPGLKNRQRSFILYSFPLTIQDHLSLYILNTIISGWTNHITEYKEGAYYVCARYKLHHTARVNHTHSNPFTYHTF